MILPIVFDWDDGNDSKDRLKHGVTVDECEEIFFNDPYLSEDAIHSLIELRIKALGKTNKGRRFFLVFTVREGKISVISARDQNKKEKLINNQEVIKDAK